MISVWLASFVFGHETVSKQIEGAPHEVLLVLDATTGQNAVAQAEMFTKRVQCTGLILATGVRRLERSRGRREVCRTGFTCDVGLARGVDLDYAGRVVRTAPEIGGKEQYGAGGVKLRHKGVQSAAQGRIQHRAGGRAAGGEISRGRLARHIGRACGIHRDPEALLAAAPAQVGGIAEDRVNDERSALVIRGQLKADPIRAF